MEPDPQTKDFERYRDRGDAAALARVFDATAPHLLRIARHLVPDRALAEDAVSNAFLAAVENAAEFDASRPVLPWLVGVLLNKVRAINKQRARVELDAFAALATEPAAPSSDDPHAAAERREFVASLARAVGELPGAERAVLVPYLFEGRGGKELAAVLDVAPGAARMRIHRGLATLRKLLPIGLGLGLGALLDRKFVDELKKRVFRRAGLAPPAASVAASAGKAALTGALLVGAGIGGWWGMKQLAPLPREPKVEAPPVAPIVATDSPVVAADSDPARTTAPPAPRAPRAPADAPKNAPATADPKLTHTVEVIGFPESAFTLVPGGTAVIGMDESEIVSFNIRYGDSTDALLASVPRRTVRIEPFYVSVIRNLDWREAHGKHPGAELERDDVEPATNLTFEEAEALAAARGMRVIREAEWEFLARGESGRTFRWGGEFALRDAPDSRTAFLDRMTWTSSSFAAYPQHELNLLRPSAPTRFDETLRVIRGPQGATPADSVAARRFGLGAKARRDDVIAVIARTARPGADLIARASCSFDPEVAGAEWSEFAKSAGLDELVGIEKFSAPTGRVPGFSRSFEYTGVVLAPLSGDAARESSADDALVGILVIAADPIDWPTRQGGYVISLNRRTSKVRVTAFDKPSREFEPPLTIARRVTTPEPAGFYRAADPIQKRFEAPRQQFDSTTEELRFVWTAHGTGGELYRIELPLRFRKGTFSR